MAVINLAHGRPLPDLLFVTSTEAIRQLGKELADALKAAVPANRLFILDPTPSSADTAMKTVRPVLQSLPDIKGVVLIGGYDSVPSRQIDALDKALRQRLGTSNIREDHDRFYVWNDDIYGDRDGDVHGLAELPVSRIPSGASAALVVGALRAANPSMPIPRRGIRNSLRPYADEVYAILPGRDEIVVFGSEPIDPLGANALAADRVYLALHGEFENPARFKGGTEEGAQPIALEIDMVPEQSGAVVLAACCWSALIVDQQAFPPLCREPSPRTDADSIALRFIQRGATAFVGFTGSHYPPLTKPYDYYGLPLQTAFWRNIVERALPPAQALFEAKAEYIVAAPHHYTDDVSLACEMKTFWSATCLGLGW